MKFILTLFTLLTLTLSFSQTELKWKKFEKATLITLNNVSEIKTFENTPESVLTYFWASKMRKDNKWNEVFLDAKNRSESLKKNLLRYEDENLKLTQFKIIEKSNHSKDKVVFNIFFEYIYDEERDSGYDGIMLQKIKEKWRVTSIPR